MLFITVFALFASVAFAAPSVDVAQLDQVVDLAIAEIAAQPAGTLNGVTLRGLESLKRSNCALKNGVYVCHATTNQAVVSSAKDGEVKVSVSIPISVHVNGDIFEKFTIGEVEVEEVDEDDSEYGLWKKIKKAAKKVVNGAKKIVKTAAQIAIETAKAAAQKKANDLANKAIGVVISKIPVVGK